MKANTANLLTADITAGPHSDSTLVSVQLFKKKFDCIKINLNLENWDGEIPKAVAGKKVRFSIMKRLIGAFFFVKAYICQLYLNAFCSINF